MAKKVPLTLHEVGEVYSALKTQLDFYEKCFVLDEKFSFEYPYTYSGYLNCKSAFEKVKSLYFG